MIIGEERKEGEMIDLASPAPIPSIPTIEEIKEPPPRIPTSTQDKIRQEALSRSIEGLKQKPEPPSWEVHGHRARFHQELLKEVYDETKGEEPHIALTARILNEEPGYVRDNSFEARQRLAEHLQTTEKAVDDAMHRLPYLQQAYRGPVPEYTRDLVPRWEVEKWGDFDPDGPLMQRTKGIMGGAVARTVTGQRVAYIGTKLAHNFYNDPAEEARVEAEAVEMARSIAPPASRNWRERALEGLAGEYSIEMGGELAARFAAMGIGSLAGPKGSAVGFFLGGYAFNYQQLAGQMYVGVLLEVDETNRMREALGIEEKVEIERDVVRQHVLATAATLAVPFTISTGGIFKSAYRAVFGRKAVEKTIKEALAMGWVKPRMLKHSVGPGMRQVVQFPAAVATVVSGAAVGTDIATQHAIESADITRSYIGDVSLGRSAALFGHSWVDTFQLTLGHGALFGGASMASGTRSFYRQVRDLNTLNAAESKLAEIIKDNPGIFDTGVLEHALNKEADVTRSLPEVFYVDVETWNAAVAGVGEPAEIAGQFLKDGQKRYSDAVEQNHMIEIEGSEWLGRLLGQEWAQPLRDALRFEDGGLTRAELRAAPERIQTIAQEAIETEAEIEGAEYKTFTELEPDVLSEIIKRIQRDQQEKAAAEIATKRELFTRILRAAEVREAHKTLAEGMQKLHVQRAEKKVRGEKIDKEIEAAIAEDFARQIVNIRKEDLARNIDSGMSEQAASMAARDMAAQVEGIATVSGETPRAVYADFSPSAPISVPQHQVARNIADVAQEFTAKMPAFLKEVQGRVEAIRKLKTEDEIAQANTELINFVQERYKRIVDEVYQEAAKKFPVKLKQTSMFEMDVTEKQTKTKRSNKAKRHKHIAEQILKEVQEEIVVARTNAKIFEAEAQAMERAARGEAPGEPVEVVTVERALRAVEAELGLDAVDTVRKNNPC